MQDMRQAPRETCVSGRRWGHLYPLLRDGTRSDAYLPSRVRIPERGTPAREAYPVWQRPIIESRYCCDRGIHSSPRRVSAVLHILAASSGSTNAGAVDSDIIDALEALIQTHRTLESGLYYETRAQNSIAAGIQRSFAASLADYRKLRTEREHLSPVRNSEILAILVFLHRLGLAESERTTAWTHVFGLLRQMTPEPRSRRPAPGIIL